MGPCDRPHFVNHLDPGLRGTTSTVSSRADRGNSTFDARHRYVLTYIWELPIFKHGSRAATSTLGGWGVSGITTLQTGFPFNITEPQDRCLCGNRGAQRPDYIGGAVEFYEPRSVSAVPGRPNSWFDGTGASTNTGAPNPYFRRVGSGQSFAQGAGRYGNFGRNVFHSPGINNRTSRPLNESESGKDRR